MQPKHRTILHALERGPKTGAELGKLTKLTPAKVRIIIGALRDKGYFIPSIEAGEAYTLLPSMFARSSEVIDHNPGDGGKR